jgi:hypothetical protein
MPDILSASWRRDRLDGGSGGLGGESGGRALFLDTHVTNAEARAFFGAIGYRELRVMLMKELWLGIRTEELNSRYFRS